MSDPTLDDLLDPESEDEVLSYLLTTLASLGFSTGSWASGGRLYTMLRAFAKGSSKLLASIAEVAKGGLLGLATGPWLTLLAKEVYDVTRNYVTDPSGNVTQIGLTYAEGNVPLNVASGAGPYTIAPGASIIYDSLRGLRFISTNSGNVTLSAGPSSTLVPYRAESAGAAYNVPVGTGIGFVTPLPGVTATFADTLGIGTWLTKFGSDDESDEALRIRCRTKWATLGIQRVADAYVFLAMNVPNVGTAATKILVDGSNPRGPGTTDIWLASNAGPLPTADETLIRNYLLALKSPAADLQVQNATALGITIGATVYYQGAYVTAIADATASLQSYVSALPIGATIYLAQILEYIMAIPGVVNVPLNSLTINGTNGDHQLAKEQVAVLLDFNATEVKV